MAGWRRIAAALVSVLVLAGSAEAAQLCRLGGLGAAVACTAHALYVGQGGETSAEEVLPDCDDVSGQHLNYNRDAAQGSRLSCGTTGKGHTINEEAGTLADRPVLRFIGSTFTCVDNAGAGRTDCSSTAISAVVQDTAPVLGGALDLSDKDIQNTTPTFVLTPTEMSYLDGVTSAIQTQLAGKAALANCATHASSDLQCTGEQLTIITGAVGLAELGACTGSAAGEYVKYGSGGAKSCATVTGGHLLRDEGNALAIEPDLNFAGSIVVCVDNSGATRTDCTFSAMRVVAEEGSGLTAREAVNFIGTDVTCVDNGGSSRTDCTVSDIDGHVIIDNGGAETQRAGLNLIGPGVSCADNAGSNRTDCTITATGHTIQDEGTGQTTRTGLNFIGSAITCADDAGNNRTNCTVTGGTGHSIKDETTLLTDRTVLKFTGSGVTCTDVSSETVCSIPGGSGGSGGHVIIDETSALPQRDNLAFTGGAITCTTLDGGTTKCDVGFSAFSVGQLAGTPKIFDFSADFDLDCITDPTTCTVEVNSTVYTEGDTVVPTSAANLPNTGTWPATSVVWSNFKLASSTKSTVAQKIVWDGSTTPPMFTRGDGTYAVPLRACWYSTCAVRGDPAGFDNWTNSTCSLGSQSMQTSTLNTHPFENHHPIATHRMTAFGLRCAFEQDVENTFTFTGQFRKTTHTQADCAAATDGGVTTCAGATETTSSGSCTKTGTTATNENECTNFTGSFTCDPGEACWMRAQVPNGTGTPDFFATCAWVTCLDNF